MDSHFRGNDMQQKTAQFAMIFENASMFSLNIFHKIASLYSQ